MDRYFPKDKIIKTGNPVREELIDVSNKRKAAAEFFNLDSRLVVLVVGGSQGASAINKGVEKILTDVIGSNLQLIWQTGKLFFNEAKEKVGSNNQVKVYEFIDHMDLAYAAADIVISRAGAIAISELCLVKKPVIFVPLPSAAEDHQTKNALALVEHEAAILIKEENLDKNLRSTLINLSENTDERNKLSMNIGRLAIPNASEIIVDEIMNLLSKKN
jgi:UDP-N-acetylglucosamine--N-acetylmuramyl-(pentapeptide) pyrophosphoryl-undecaprenol N-acetylglucosamine transferase